MFYLGGSSFPQTREALVAAVTDGLRSLLALAAGKEIVRIDPGGAPANDYPNYSRVAIDLTGCKLVADQLPPEPKGIGQAQPAGIAARLEVVGHPLYVRGSAVDLSLTAADARFNFDRDVGGRLLLLLMNAKNGNVTLQMRKADLDALALTAAKEAVAKQGVQILETQLTVTQAGDRAVAAEVRVRAKKLFLTATLHLRGKLTVDDALNARISDLTIAGDGALGEIASAAIRPQFQQIDGKVIPLTALPLGEVRLHDLKMQVGDPLKVTALFGG